MFLTLLSLAGFSPKNHRSFFYNKAGKLYANPSLKISERQLEFWNRAEINIITKLAESMEYPPAAFRNFLQGRIILAFDVAPDSVSNIRIVSKKLGGDIESVTIKNIEKNKPFILHEFKSHQRSVGSDYTFIGTYYIPFDFKQLDFAKEVKKKHTLLFIELSKPKRTFIYNDRY